MSRFLLLLVLLAVTAVTAQTAAKAAVCTTSGDPHTTTFDGVNTDFQGNGCFQYVSHSHLSIQCCQYPCNPRVTCIRNCVAKVFTHTLTYGWDATTNTYDTIMIDNVATPVKTITDAMKTAAGGVVLTAVNPPQEKNVLVTYVGNQLRFTYNTGGDRSAETSTVIPVTVVFAPRYLAVSLPTTEPYGYSGVTYGLCGKFDGNFQNDFTAKTTGGVDNMLYSIPSSFDLKGRINNAQTIAWGLANAVSGDGSTPYTALQTTFHQYSAQSHRYIVTSTVPTATANDTAEQLANVNFNNLEDLESARTKCQASATSLSDADSKAQYENCVYDLAYTNDIGIALSNIEAAQTKAALTATPSSSGGSGTDGAKVAAIVVGCVAGVAILAAFVLFRKYRRAQSDLSRALVLRRSESNEQNTGGIALEENL